MMNTYEFKTGSVKVLVKADDIDLAYDVLYAKIKGAAELGIELPSSNEFYLYTTY